MDAREEELSARTKAAFIEAAGRHQLPPEAAAASGEGAAHWRHETSDASAKLAEHARFFDLIVLGRSERVVEQPYTDAIERVLNQSGRPVVLAPDEPPAEVGVIVAIAWNVTAEAVRAAVAALPLMTRAKTVSIITLEERHEASADALQSYLGLYGVPATVHHSLSVPGLRPGEQLLSSAREDGTDLLVMGGYNRSPWRQTLFGGASRTVIGISLMPLLIAH